MLLKMCGSKVAFFFFCFPPTRPIVDVLSSLTTKGATIVGTRHSLTTMSSPNHDYEEAGGFSFSNVKSGITKAVQKTKEEYVSCYEEVKYECTPDVRPLSYYTSLTKHTLRSWIHIPYFPAFHRPGWLMRYVFGPYDEDWVTLFIADFCAGLTVSLTLIPQALSYAQLANLPAINGLYTAILPSVTYVFFGSSMQLAVGPGNEPSSTLHQLPPQHASFTLITTTHHTQSSTTH